MGKNWKPMLVTAVIVLAVFLAVGTAAAQELAEAEKEFAVGNYKQTVKMLKNITRKNPAESEAWLLLGKTYTALGKEKRALKTYLTLKSLDPSHDTIQYQLGMSYARLEDHANAVKAYLKFLQSHPQHALAHFRLGVSYDREHQFTHAFEQHKILKNIDAQLAQQLYDIIFMQ